MRKSRTLVRPKPLPGISTDSRRCAEWAIKGSRSPQERLRAAELPSGCHPVGGRSLGPCRAPKPGPPQGRGEPPPHGTGADPKGAARSGRNRQAPCDPGHPPRQPRHLLTPTPDLPALSRPRRPSSRPPPPPRHRTTSPLAPPRRRPQLARQLCPNFPPPFQAPHRMHPLC